MSNDETRQWAQTEIQEIPYRHRNKPFLSKGGQRLQHTAQRGCGVSVLGVTQNLTVLSPEQVAVAYS